MMFLLVVLSEVPRERDESKDLRLLFSPQKDFAFRAFSKS
jgi:hypothetical protein